MAIIYNKVARKNPMDRAQVKYYASAKTIKLVDEREVANLIAEETTLNPKEAEMALHQLQKVVLRLLKSSYSVKIGDWASFYVGLSSEGVTDPKDVNTKLIKDVHVNCRFGKTFKESLAKSTFMAEEELRGKNI